MTTTRSADCTCANTAAHASATEVGDAGIRLAVSSSAGTGTQAMSAVWLASSMYTGRLVSRQVWSAASMSAGAAAGLSIRTAISVISLKIR